MGINKIIINFCPTGMVPTKKVTPHVPISPQEIIEETHQAFETGITIVHLHARLHDGTPTHKRSVYEKIFDGIRKYCPDLILCGSTSGRINNQFEKRSEVIELMPDMCSLTLSSLNFMQSASLNSPDVIQKLASKMKHYGVKPELECFDLGMINYGRFLVQKGVIDNPIYWNLIFGNIAGFQNNLHHISAALTGISENEFVAFGGVGACQLPINSMAIANGYGVRVGIEDNIWWDKKRRQFATNKMLLDRIHELIVLNQKEFMPSTELGNQGFYNNKLKRNLVKNR